MNRFLERLLCSIMLSVGVIVLLDSRGVRLGVEGVIGLATITAAIGYLFLPDES